MTSTTPRIVMVGVTEIIAAPFNPPNRTEKDALKILEQSIRDLGMIVVPLIISRDMRLIDGHRRLACAKKLGMVEVPCIITSLGLQEGWTRINTSSMPISGKQFVYASAAGLDDAYLPKSQRRKIQRLRQLAGEHYDELADQGISTNVLDTVNRVARHTGDKSDVWLSAILLWVVRHKLQYVIRKAIDGGITPEAMRNAIKEDRELRQSWQ